MTRIRTASGEEFVAITRTRKIRNGVIAGALGLILLPFLAAATIGLVRATERPMGPDAHTLQLLQDARSHSTTPCWAEWNEIQNGFEVICAAH